MTRWRPGGRLYLPTGTLQDENAILAAARRVFGDNIEPVLERTFPLPDLVAKAAATARLMKEGLLKLHQRGSRLLWEPSRLALRASLTPRAGSRRRYSRLSRARPTIAHSEHHRAHRQQDQAVDQRGPGDDHAEHHEDGPRRRHGERPDRRRPPTPRGRPRGRRRLRHRRATGRGAIHHSATIAGIKPKNHSVNDPTHSSVST